MSEDQDGDDWDHFYLDGLQPMEDEEAPKPELLAEIAWRRDVYDFEYFYALVMGDYETPTASRLEVAYSQQLGGAFVVWFSGVSSREAPDFCIYGWIDCPDLKEDFSEAFYRRARIIDAPITGYWFNSTAYYERFPAQA